MTAIRANNKRLVIGLGITGLSVARWCVREKLAFDLLDTRSQLAHAAEIAQEFPEAQLYLEELTTERLCQYQELIVSPGVAIAHPAVQQAISQGIQVRGDIDLFAEHCQAPIVAITGSNGKSTVATLVGEMLVAAGVNVAVGGNIGVPALDLPAAEVYVLELSSFQLETTHQLKAKVATVLNISEDHLDRYAGMPEYIATKQRIYHNAECVVVNRQDAATYLQALHEGSIGSFGLDSTTQAGDFGLLEHSGVNYLAQAGQPLLATSELKIKGRHNQANALAALAIVAQLGVELQNVLPALTQFAGLPHRCQWLGEKDGVNFYNDSKGTNVGSTVAAISGLGPDTTGKIWLLAGGEGKGQDFSPLAQACEPYVAAVIGFGKDAQQIGAVLAESCSFVPVATLAEAFAHALAHAVKGDAIVLSPACASLDQFKNYIERGQAFSAMVEAVL